MGNFFRVTCPFLFILDTVAFFPIIRGKHSVQAVNKILNTTQLFNNEKTMHYSPEKLEASRDIVGEFATGEVLKDIVHVYDVSDRNCEVFNDIANEHLLITC